MAECLPLLPWPYFYAICVAYLCSIDNLLSLGTLIAGFERLAVVIDWRKEDVCEKFADCILETNVEYEDKAWQCSWKDVFTAETAKAACHHCYTQGSIESSYSERLEAIVACLYRRAGEQGFIECPPETPDEGATITP
jgi:hypothetical protein